MSETTATWVGTTGHPSGDWGTAADWSTGTIPNKTTAVVIDLTTAHGTPFGVTIAAPAAAYRPVNLGDRHHAHRHVGPVRTN